MKYFLKSWLTGLFVSATISTVSAQKIDDQNLKLNVDGVTNVRYNDVSHADLVPVLVQAIKDQQQQIELLKKEISSLKQK